VVDRLVLGVRFVDGAIEMNVAVPVAAVRLLPVVDPRVVHWASKGMRLLKNRNFTQ